MKSAFAKYTSLSVAIIFVSIIVAGAITYHNSELYQDTNDQVYLTQQVLNESEQVISILKDIETGARGYIITGDSVFLEPLNKGSGIINGHLVKLQSLVSQNPLQKKRADSLAFYVEKKIGTAAQNVKVRAEKGFNESRNIVVTKEGMFYMDDVRRITAEIQGEHTRLLQQRKMVNAKSIANFNRMFFVLLVTIFFLLIVFFISIRSNLKARKLQAEKLNDFNQLLVQKVKEKTAELSNIFERITDAFIALDKNYCYTYVNQRTGLLINKSPGDLIGKCVWDVFPDVVGSRTYHSFVKAMNEQVYICDTDYYAPLNLWQENHVYPSKDGLSIFIRDITAKKRAEAEKDNLLEVIQKSLNEIYIFNPSSLLFEYANEGALNNTGYTLNQLTAMEPINIKPAYTQATFHELIAPLQKGLQDKVVFETIHRRADGSTYYVEEHLQLINNGNHPVFISVIIDITKRKEDEQALIQLNTELAQQAADLQASNTELERFAYVASHDLQEPLRMVSSFLQLLEMQYKEKLDEPAREYIRFAVDGATRMKALILDLLIYSKAGSVKEHFAPTDMNEVVNIVSTTFEPVLKEKNGSLLVHPLPLIKAVKSQMLQLFQNLVGNAIKYCKEDVPPRIEITCKELANSWEFTVSDNGIGIDSKYFHKVFIIFQRLHNNSQYSGTGIGLAICKKIVERHGGQIAAHSKLGEGTSFIFTLTK